MDVLYSFISPQPSALYRRFNDVARSAITRVLEPVPPAGRGSWKDVLYCEWQLYYSLPLLHSPLFWLFPKSSKLCPVALPGPPSLSRTITLLSQPLTRGWGIRFPASCRLGLFSDTRDFSFYLPMPPARDFLASRLLWVESCPCTDLPVVDYPELCLLLFGLIGCHASLLSCTFGTIFLA